MSWKTLIMASALLLAVGPGAAADADDCRNAVSAYRSSVDDISSTLRRYTSCISSSNGRDDCSYEFRRLRSAQDEFESAVSSIGTDCD